jgi:hypothetical protein
MCQGIHQMLLPHAWESTPSTTTLHVLPPSTDVDDNLSQIVTSVSDALTCHLQNTPKCALLAANQCTTASIKNPFTMSKKQAKDHSPPYQPLRAGYRVFIPGGYLGVRHNPWASPLYHSPLRRQSQQSCALMARSAALAALVARAISLR